MASGYAGAIAKTVILGTLLTSMMTSASARDLPIKIGHWTDAPSCTDPSAHDAGNARRFSPGTTSTANDDCRMTVNQVRGQTYSIHLTCTYVQGGSGASDIVVTVVTPAKIQWRSIDPAGETTYRFCGSR